MRGANLYKESHPSVDVGDVFGFFQEICPLPLRYNAGPIKKCLCDEMSGDEMSV